MNKDAEEGRGYSFTYGFTEKVVFEQSLEFERTSSSSIGGKGVTGRGNSMCKGPEVPGLWKDKAQGGEQSGTGRQW